MLNSDNNFETEISFSVASEQELIASFRPLDQKKLILPVGLKYPLKIRSYFTWKESSGVYNYLLFKKPTWDLPKGVVFKRARQPMEFMGTLCSWCHSYTTSDEIEMLSVAMNSNISAGYILCRDLRCVEKIEESANLSGKNPEYVIHKLYDKIGLFFENLSLYKLE